MEIVQKIKAGVFSDYTEHRIFESRNDNNEKKTNNKRFKLGPAPRKAKKLVRHHGKKTTKVEKTLDR